jgi:hypothetical protein
MGARANVDAAVKKSILSLPVTECRFLCRAACSVVAVLTELHVYNFRNSPSSSDTAAVFQNFSLCTQNGFGVSVE